MATEGEYPKIDGDILYGSEVNTFSQTDNAGTTIFQNMSQLIYNADLIGFDSELDQEFAKVLFDTELEAATGSDFTRGPLIPYTVIDEFDDSSLDAAQWSTTHAETAFATTFDCTEDTDGVHFTGSGSGDGGNGSIGSTTLEGDGASGHNFYADKTTLFQLKLTGSGDPSMSIKIYLTDGSTDVKIFEKTSTTNPIPNKTNYRLNVDTNADTCNFTSAMSDNSPAGTNLSSLGGTDWDLLVVVSTQNQPNGSSSYSGTIYVLRLMDDDATADFVFDVGTATEDVTNGLLNTNSTSTSGATIAYALAADGTNYESVTKDELHDFTVSGTDIKLKATIDTTSGTYPDTSTLNHLAVWYNLR